MKRIINIILCFLGLSFANTLNAQTISSLGMWSYYRWELGAGIGGSNFLGDLGGRDMIGSDFIYDLEVTKTHFTFNGFVSYRMMERLRSRLQFTYAKVSGDDALTQEFYRNNRNLSFHSNIFELSSLLQLTISKEYTKNETTKKGFFKTNISAAEIYAIGGVGLFYYNPKTKLDNGDNIHLKPLRTEGQGLPGGPEEYSNFNVSIPIGIGFRRSLENTTEWGVQVEFLYRFTFTDYIDDVSTNYYNKDYLSNHIHPLSGTLSDRSPNPNYITSTGMQRGNPDNKDGYFTVSVCFNKNRGRKWTKKVKRSVRKVRANF